MWTIYIIKTGSQIFPFFSHVIQIGGSGIRKGNKELYFGYGNGNGILIWNLGLELEYAVLTWMFELDF